jgi:uncharacterized protein YjbI with pentapeptide repeats
VEILNDTPFPVATIVGKVPFPGYSLSVIVKGTFRFSQGHTAEPASQQQLATGDQDYETDEEMRGSCRYESDFAYFKPRADLLLIGKCHPPEHEAVPFCAVTFRVGSTVRNLNIFGERRWAPGLAHSAPQPFTEMEIRYENSFGGAGYKKNPVGKGYLNAQPDKSEQAQPLPNIEAPIQRVDWPQSEPHPAGFGPLRAVWEDRSSKLGTYDDKWLKERWPWFPADFDWSYFNAAPRPMQVKEYLRGDEELYFENLHPTYSRYHSRLPAVKVRCFLNELREAESSHTGWREVAMNLDTLWVDMESEQLVLVWRGVTNIKTEEYGEIEHAFVVSEPLVEPHKSKAEYQLMFSQILQRRAQEEERVFEPEKSQAAGDKEPDPIDDALAQAETERRAALHAAGLDPDEELPPPSDESKAAEAQLLRDLGIASRDEPAPVTREMTQTRVARGESFAGEDLSSIDLTNIRASGIDFRGVILSRVCLKGADLSGADLSGAVLAGADLSGATLAKASLKEADLTGANLAETDLTGAVLEGAILERASMPRAILDDALARDASFVEADLTQASAKRAAFAGANLARAVLKGADLRGCNLREGSLEGAVALEINLADADLTELRADEGADFSRGSFQRVIGPESIWERSVLDEADFSFARLDRASFTSASLESANFHAASLKWARLLKCTLRRATLTSTNLFEGMLEKADLTKADLSGSNLYGAELLDAVYDGARWDSANLKMTKLARM